MEAWAQSQRNLRILQAPLTHSPPHAHSPLVCAFRVTTVTKLMTCHFRQTKSKQVKDRTMLFWGPEQNIKLANKPSIHVVRYCRGRSVLIRASLGTLSSSTAWVTRDGNHGTANVRTLVMHPGALQADGAVETAGLEQPRPSYIVHLQC